MSTPRLTTKGDAVRFEVHAKPRAKKSAIRGEHGGALEVSLAAPPVDGAANEELVRFLSDVFGISKSQISIVRGEAARVKLVEIRGVTESDVRARLLALAEES